MPVRRGLEFRARAKGSLYVGARIRIQIRIRIRIRTRVQVKVRGWVGIRARFFACVIVKAWVRVRKRVRVTRVNEGFMAGPGCRAEKVSVQTE